jgi:hypothetical protein
MINFLIKRQYKSGLCQDKYIPSLLKDRYLRTGDYNHLYELIKFKNIKLFVKISPNAHFSWNCLICPLTVDKNNFIAYIGDYVNNNNELYLKVTKQDNTEIYESDIVKLSDPFIYMLYPPYQDDEDLHLIENGKLKWAPNKINIFEEILDMKIRKKSFKLGCELIYGKVKESTLNSILTLSILTLSIWILSILIL